MVVSSRNCGIFPVIDRLIPREIKTSLGWYDLLRLVRKAISYHNPTLARQEKHWIRETPVGLPYFWEDLPKFFQTGGWGPCPKFESRVGAQPARLQVLCFPKCVVPQRYSINGGTFWFWTIACNASEHGDFNAARALTEPPYLPEEIKCRVQQLSKTENQGTDLLHLYSWVHPHIRISQCANMNMEPCQRCTRRAIPCVYSDTGPSNATPSPTLPAPPVVIRPLNTVWYSPEQDWFAPTVRPQAAAAMTPHAQGSSSVSLPVQATQTTPSDVSRAHAPSRVVQHGNDGECR